MIRCFCQHNALPHEPPHETPKRIVFMAESNLESKLLKQRVVIGFSMLFCTVIPKTKFYSIFFFNLFQDYYKKRERVQLVSL